MGLNVKPQKWKITIRIKSFRISGVLLYLQDSDKTITNSSQKCVTDSPNDLNWNNSALYIWIVKITINYAWNAYYCTCFYRECVEKCQGKEYSNAFNWQFLSTPGWKQTRCLVEWRMIWWDVLILVINKQVNGLRSGIRFILTEWNAFIKSFVMKIDLW